MSKNYVSNKDETARMFRNDFLESMSKVHFSVPLYIYSPIIVYFLYNSFSQKLSGIVLLFLSGILIWTFTEYSLHRFIFHYKPVTNFGKRMHFIFHGVHHDYPRDSKRLVMPPSVSLPLAVIFYFIFLQIFGSVYISAIFAGFLSGYLIYDMSHYAFHHLSSHNKLFLFLKKHHMKHHYQDAEKGYGVSQPIWDHLMRTDFNSQKNRN